MFGGSSESSMSKSTNLLQDSYASFVNLDHRPDRLGRMEQTLAKAGISAIRTRGLLPAEAIQHWGIDPKRVAVMQNRTPGAIGCHYCQTLVMQEALRQGKHAFVMEDDLVFCEDFQQRIAYIERFLEGREWDILWLGGTFHINPPFWHKALGRDAELTEDPRMVRTLGAFCTYAYIVNRSSVAAVLHGLDSLLDQSIGIDWAMIQMQPQLKTYAFVPGSVIQYDHLSDIGRGMTVFSNFRRLGPYWYQEKMEDFDPVSFDWHEADIGPVIEQPKIIRHRRDLWKLLYLLGLSGDAAEIGVAEGNFSRDMLAWEAVQRPIIQKLYMVDRWRCTPSVKGDSSMPQSWHDKNFERAKQQVSPFGDRAVLLQGESVEMSNRVPAQSLALLYIDGDHSYNGVMNDLNAWVPKVMQGGIVALHDFENLNYGVNQAVRDFCKIHRKTLISIPEDKPEDAGAYFIC